MLSETDMDYQIADAHRPSTPKFIRCLAFPEGQSSHTRIAVPDAIEAREMKIAAPEQPPGIKVAAPEASRGTKVAQPSGLSTTGDFRRPIRVSGEDVEARRKIGMKLYGTSMNPAYALRGKRP